MRCPICLGKCSKAVLAVVLSIAISGCAAQLKSFKSEIGMTATPVSAEEQKFQAAADEVKVPFFADFGDVLLPAVCGGVAGGIAALAGAKGGVIAAAGVGGYALCASGFWLKRKKDAFEKAENQLDHLIADAKLQNQELVTFVTTAEGYISYNKREIDKINKEIASSEERKKVISARVDSIKRARSEIEAALDGAKTRQKKIENNIKLFAKNNKGQRPKKLVSAHQEYSKNKEKLEVLMAAIEGLANSVAPKEEAS